MKATARMHARITGHLLPYARGRKVLCRREVVMTGGSWLFLVAVVALVGAVVFLVTRAFTKRNKPGADVPREDVPRE